MFLEKARLDKRFGRTTRDGQHVFGEAVHVERVRGAYCQPPGGTMELLTSGLGTGGAVASDGEGTSRRPR